MNTFINIIIPLFFISIIVQRLRRIKQIIIPTTKKYIQIIIIMIAFVSIIYFYANTWIHYVTGILAIIMFISMWLAQGIILKGFISMYRYKEIILWNEIEKAIVTSSKDIKVKVSGDFMEQTFYFKKNDYDKVINTLKQNLPTQAQLKIML